MFKLSQSLISDFDKRTTYRQIAEDILFREALYLDTKKWDKWAAMYDERAIFWAPSWLDEYDVADDSATQLSLIYHNSRVQLLERISRIQSRKSITALPLPRTLHAISNIIIDKDDHDGLDVRSCWSVHVYDPRTYRENTYFGTYEHILRANGANWMITRKKIVLMNDRIPTVLDFYSI